MNVWQLQGVRLSAIHKTHSGKHIIHTWEQHVAKPKKQRVDIEVATTSSQSRSANSFWSICAQLSTHAQDEAARALSVCNITRLPFKPQS